MSRDHTKLDVFVEADALAIMIYRITQGFPAGERFGLQAQLRRAAVSVPCNLVEGCARRSANECVNFCNIALGSACEARYLANLANRLGFIDSEASNDLARRCTVVVKQLQRLMQALRPPAR